MNKNARKLIPAVAMLLVSASMLSTASYAWFSMNTSAAATGMKVEVAAPASILISKTNDEKTFGNSIEFTDTDYQDGGAYNGITTLGHASSVNGTKMYAVSPEDIDINGAIETDAKIYDVTANNAVDSETETLKNYTTVYGVTGAVAYVDYIMYLTTTGSEVMHVTLDAASASTGFSTTATGSTVIDALRFAVLVDDAAPMTKPDSGDGVPIGNVWQGTDNTKAAGTGVLNGTTTGQTATTAKFTGTIETPVALFDLTPSTDTFKSTKVTIRVWLEGTDAACLNKNAVKLNEFNLKLAFVSTTDDLKA